MNQLEAFKWEQRKLNKRSDETKAKVDEVKRDPPVDEAASARRIEEEKLEKELGELEKLVQAQARRHEPNGTMGMELINTDAHASGNANGSGNSNVTVKENLNGTIKDELVNATARRRADSESIYAFIIRRVNDLEGNSSLVARYIDEQSKAMRAMLNRTEREIVKKLETEDKSRWEQEVCLHMVTTMIVSC